MNTQNLNPITKLDYPDPDVISVDGIYYMVSTTMYFFPGCEILRSYNLVNWEHASFVFDRLDSTPAQRLEGKENIYGRGMWAASLRYNNGVFYICFVANDTNKTYIFTSTSIDGPWEKYTLDGFYHDNSILFDDDGKVYIVYGNKNIYLKELNLSDSRIFDTDPSNPGKLIITDDDGAFLEKSFLLRILDHGLCDTVLDAPGRIEILELYQNGCFKSQFFFYINHLNERCVSDQSQSSFVNVRHGEYLPFLMHS